MKVHEKTFSEVCEILDKKRPSPFGGGLGEGKWGSLGGEGKKGDPFLRGLEPGQFRAAKNPFKSVSSKARKNSSALGLLFTYRRAENGKNNYRKKRGGRYGYKHNIEQHI